jgi:hypothetical protein
MIRLASGHCVSLGMRKKNAQHPMKRRKCVRVVLFAWPLAMKLPVKMRNFVV